MNNIQSSLYKSHEKIFHEKHFRYPMNSLSSLFYLLLLIYCSKINNYGIFLLVGLTISSTIWWAKSTEIPHYFDLLFLFGTQLWIFSNIIKNECINYFFLIFIFINDNNLKKILIILLTISILLKSNNNYSSTLYLLSILFKLTDTYYGNKYGTSIFHILSSIAIFNFLK